MSRVIRLSVQAGDALPQLGNRSFGGGFADLRKVCRTLYGKDEGDEFLGLRGDLPRTPKELYNAFAPVVGRLADDNWPMPKRRTKAIKADREGLVDEFRGAHGRLGRALGVIEEGETREAVLKVARNRAKKLFEDFTAKSARCLEAGLDLAGLDDLVGIVRPGVGRRGRPASKTKLDATAPRDALPAGDEPKALPAPSTDEPKVLPVPSTDEPDEPDNP